jgi:hypothetical protein
MDQRSQRRRPVGRPTHRQYSPVPSARSQFGTRVLRDSSTLSVSAKDWLGASGRDQASDAEIRAENLLRMNRGLLGDMHVHGEVARSRGQPVIRFITSTRIGAIPLLSPLSGRPDFGLVVEPRFSWAGVGDVLATTGFRVLPDLLPLAELPQSERNIPPWVLSSVVLYRMERLLENSARRFAMVQSDLPAPKGAVDWTSYATQKVSVGRFLSVPSRFPDLRDDEPLRSAIHWTARRQREALLAAPAGGLIARRLIAVADRLITRLAGAPPRRPTPQLLQHWKTHPLGGRVYAEGVDAIEWTIDDRGLAGLSDLSGLAWRLDMEAFFEAWVESIAEAIALRVGATLKVGRRGDTRIRVQWQPQFAGSLQSLLPDAVLVRDGLVIVFDAKYKGHAREITRLGWRDTPESIREQHRHDVHQMLAYVGLFDSPRRIGLLVYPCELDEWTDLVNRGLDMITANVQVGGATTTVARLSVPFGGSLDTVVDRTLARLGPLLQ